MHPKTPETRIAARARNYLRSLWEGARLRSYGLAVAGVLLAHVALLAWQAGGDSPLLDEAGHLVAGVEYWTKGSRQLDLGNPPLVGAVAALPVLASRPKTDWAPRHETFGIGLSFLEINGARAAMLVTVARLACIPWSLLGAWACFAFAKALFGRGAALVALFLWCFCPNVLGLGHVVTADVAVASLGVAASYRYWKWLRFRTFDNALAAGALLGLANTAKFVALAWYFVWPAVWLAWRICEGRQPRAAILKDFLHASLLVGTSVLVIDVAYAFVDVPSRLGDALPLDNRPAEDRARQPLLPSWCGPALTNAPLPLPVEYLRGLLQVRLDSLAARPVYCRGTWHDQGGPAYYAYTLLVKVPLGTWLLLLLAAVPATTGGTWRESTQNAAVVLLPACGMLASIGLGTGYPHLRYLLPAFPFAFVWAARAALPRARVALGYRLVAAGALLANLASVAAVQPHSLSYFNELAGGPARGHEHLLDTNVDWGQDSFYLKRWIDAHPEARPLYVQYAGAFTPAQAGIECPPLLAVTSQFAPGRDPASYGPLPGWHAIGVNLLHGFPRRVYPFPGWAGEANRPYYECFDRFSPVARAGYSVLIYRISLDEANAIRRELGLPELAAAPP